MSGDPIEAAARAIFPYWEPSWIPGVLGDPERLRQKMQAEALEKTRAAIAAYLGAMTEPTDSIHGHLPTMMRAGSVILREIKSISWDRYTRDDFARRIWKAMRQAELESMRASPQSPTL